MCVMISSSLFSDGKTETVMGDGGFGLLPAAIVLKTCHIDNCASVNAECK